MPAFDVRVVNLDSVSTLARWTLMACKKSTKSAVSASMDTTRVLKVNVPNALLDVKSVSWDTRSAPNAHQTDSQLQCVNVLPTCLRTQQRWSVWLWIIKHAQQGV